MGHSTNPPTKADVARFEKLQALGCIACRQSGSIVFPVHIHHCLSGGRRRGHQFTLPLCVWHHVSQPNEGRTAMQMLLDYGPSLARGSKAFHIRYGYDDELLAEVSRLLGES